MEMVSWSLNAIDSIYSTLRKTGRGQPGCPQDTYPAGFVLDSWNEYRAVCLSVLSLEDTEDLYIFGFMVIGFLLIGSGSYWIYWQTEKLRLQMEKQRSETRSELGAVLEAIGGLKEQLDVLIRTEGTRTQQFGELVRREDAQRSDLSCALGLIRDLSSRLEKLCVRVGSS